MRFSDLYECNIDYSHPIYSFFERFALPRTQRTDVAARQAIFEFADLSDAILERGNFSKANFIGAVLTGAKATDCQLDGADFYWTRTDVMTFLRCTTAGTRYDEPDDIVYGPQGIAVPVKSILPLHRAAATAAERRHLLLP